MQICKIHSNTVISLFDIFEKARDDTFKPITGISNRYKTWVAHIDLKTCPFCREYHGKIFETNEIPLHEPPVHPNCRCNIQPLKTIKAGLATNNGKDGADYWLKYNGELPDYYISEQQLESIGWKHGDRLSQYAPGRMLGRSFYQNKEHKLPDAPERIWYEADINYSVGRRNLHRIYWSNDGLIFVTYDHGKTFYEIV